MVVDKAMETPHHHYWIFDPGMELGTGGLITTFLLPSNVSIWLAKGLHFGRFVDVAWNGR